MQVHRWRRIFLATFWLVTLKGAAYAAWRALKPNEALQAPVLEPMTLSATKLQHPSGQEFHTDEWRWFDSQNKPRTANLVRNSSQDPSGHYGGYLRRYRYLKDDREMVCTGSSDEHPGFGYLINHHGEGGLRWLNSSLHPGEHRVLLAGRHHAIYEFTWPLAIDEHQFKATVHWFFANGRDHPIYAVTYDLSHVPADVIKADARSPYGDIGFDGDQKSVVTGVAWGDRYRFLTTDTPVTMDSGWTYSEPNTIPYTRMWSLSTASEMGLVQTQTWRQHDAGGYWFYRQWGRNSAGPMPVNWNWTYQLHQYQIEQDPTAKRHAWGLNYGSVGHRSYPVYGEDAEASGHPYQSYAVAIVLGQHQPSSVMQQVRQMEVVQSVRIGEGGINPRSHASGGPGRSDLVLLEPLGWNPIYGVFDCEWQTGGRASLEFTVEQGRWQNPMFRIYSPTANFQISYGGRRLTPDRDYLVSVDPKQKLIWLTLRGTYRGTHTFVFAKE